MYGAKIAIIRSTLGYTQDYVAKQIGISQGSYSKIEKDEVVKLDDDILEKIAKTLGVSVEDIKSPLPIVMHFQNSPNSGLVNSNFQNTDMSVIELLAQQLKEKDAQIAKLLALLEKKK